MNNIIGDPMAHEFGGEWTEKKLLVVQRYFDAYATALKNKRFKKWYVDAFAGTGTRQIRTLQGEQFESMFGEDADEISDTKEGSARIALSIRPPFDRYIFIEQSPARASELSELAAGYSESDISILEQDANIALTEIARTTDWRRTRAAIFIDPYGMQVDWKTLVALSETKAVDMALLFPTGPLNRLLTRDGEIPEAWARRIDAHLGPCDWRTAVYKETADADLFESRTRKTEKVMDADGLRNFVRQRLQNLFPYVCNRDLALVNSRGAILFHLFIICANPNPKAIGLASRLANSAMNI